MTNPGPPPPAGRPMPPGQLPQPQWGSYRHQQMPPPPQPGPAAAVKPGIVPLAPLSLGTILGGAFSSYRFNPRAMILLPFLLFAVIAIPGAPLGYLLSTGYALDSSVNSFTGQFDPGVEVIPGLLGLAGLALVSSAIIPFVASCIHGAVIGRKLTVAEIWAATRSRIPAIIGYTLLLGLAMTLSFAIVALPLLLGNVAAVITGVVLLLGCAVGWIWLSTKLLLAPAAIALESLGPIAAARRSFELTRGAFWPILGTYLLTSIIVSIAQQVIATAVGIPLTVLLLTRWEDQPQMMWVVNTPVTLLLLAIVMPFTYAVVTLIYTDRRIKREAYDVELAQQAFPPPPPAPTGPPPPGWGGGPPPGPYGPWHTGPPPPGPPPPGPLQGPPPGPPPGWNRPA